MRYTIIQSVLLLLLFASRFANDSLLLLERTSLTRATGLALLAASLILAALAYISLRHEFRVGPQPRADGRLVTTGVYRHLRHPMYTSVVLFAAGFFLSKPTANMAVAAVALVAFYLIKARHEEKMLAARYPEYASYRASTFGVLPLRRTV